MTDNLNIIVMSVVYLTIDSILIPFSLSVFSWPLFTGLHISDSLCTQTDRKLTIEKFKSLDSKALRFERVTGTVSVTRRNV